MIVPKLIAVLLRGLLKYAQIMGIVYFRVKNTDVLNVSWLKWISVIIRLITVSIFAYDYFLIVLGKKWIILKVILGMRLILCIPSNCLIMEFQIFRGSEVIELVKNFLKMFRKVKKLCRRQEMGFRAKWELFLILTIACIMPHEALYILAFRASPQWNFQDVRTIFFNGYITMGTNVFLHINFLVYLSFGFLYSELNKYIFKNLMPLLQDQGLQSDPRQMRKLRRKLERCFNLYRDIFTVNTVYQRFFQLPLALGLVHKIMLTGSVAYVLVIERKFQSFWMIAIIFKHIYDLLLLTYSVQRAVTESSIIRLVNFETFGVSSLKEFRILLDTFYTYLNLNKFRVCILGLFDVSNRLFLLVLSAIISWLVFVIQYGLQMGHSWN
ncbi:putative gustatory receptor 92a [Drosophila ananassae]|nr:putative gustatory receptor 92a [Drosophila ananassae]